MNRVNRKTVNAHNPQCRLRVTIRPAVPAAANPAWSQPNPGGKFSIPPGWMRRPSRKFSRQSKNPPSMTPVCTVSRSTSAGSQNQTDSANPRAKPTPIIMIRESADGQTDTSPPGLLSKIWRGVGVRFIHRAYTPASGAKISAETLCDRMSAAKAIPNPAVRWRLGCWITPSTAHSTQGYKPIAQNSDRESPRMYTFIMCMGAKVNTAAASRAAAAFLR